MKNPTRIVSAALAICLVVPGGTAHATDESTPDSVVPTTTVTPVTTEAPSTTGSPSTTSARSTSSAPSTATTTTVLARRPQRTRVTIAYSRIVLDEQRAYFYNANRRLIATLRVSTGVDDQTPTGVFRVFSKSERTFYTPNPSERMRYMTRFTVGREGGNIGFHGIPYTVTKFGEIPFYTPLGLAPSSHGCIRMKVSDAQWVFENMPLGATVSVVRSRR